jgi:SAM-dependent methyltransferase
LLPVIADRSFTYTFGALDGVSVDGAVVSASGWVVGLEGDISNLVFECGGPVLVSDAATVNEASPDVFLVHPDLPNTSNCRFHLTAQLPAESCRKATGMLMSIVPMVGAKRGVPLERIVPLRLPIPRPDQSVTVGQGDFVETSFSMLALFRLVAGLEPHARVLDPGCGIGRIAFALFHYLDDGGRYDGFDVSADSIALARSIFSDSKNFAFQHVDLYNKMYNPAGALRSADFAFPFPAGHFDTVVLTSVFTHMLPDDIRNYLAEIARVLVSGGSCLATYFVLDAIAKENLKSGRATLNIVHPVTDYCFVENPVVPENAVAYDYPALAGMIADAGLCIEQVHWGKWSGRSNFLSYQDVFLLRKP